MRIFISYARVNWQSVENLDKRLRRYHDVWYDDRLQAGQDWWQTILQRLDWCECFIYVLTPESLASEYCLKEYKEAKRLKRQIVPVQMQPNITLPDDLANIQYTDFANRLFGDALADLIGDLGQLELSRIQSEYIRLKTRNESPSFQDRVKDAAQVDIVGLSLKGLLNNNRALLLDMANSGCKFRLLLVHPDSIVFAPGIDHQIDRKTDISQSKELLKDMQATGNMELGFTSIIPPFGLVITDSDKDRGSVSVEFIAYNLDADKRLLFSITRANDSRGYEFFINQFELLWKDSERQL
jgi:hypothetical protein